MIFDNFLGIFGSLLVFCMFLVQVQILLQHNFRRLTSILTQIHGCFKASAAVIRLYGLTVNIWLIKFFASGVTVSHSGDGYCQQIENIKNVLCHAILTVLTLNCLRTSKHE